MILTCGCTSTPAVPVQIVTAAPTPVPTPVYKVTIPAINLNIAYNGKTNGYLGPTSQSVATSLPTVNGGDEFTETLTLHSSALVFTHSIDNMIITTQGFTIESITPNLPYSFSPGSSMSFTLEIKTPMENYDGPINLLIETS